MLSDNTKYIVRDSAVLTTSYVAGKVLGQELSADPSKHNQLIIYVDFTKGSLTTGEVKVEFSPDGRNWYQETASSISSGTITETVGEHQFSVNGKYRLAIPMNDAYVRISAKGTGTVTGSLMGISALLGNS
jgi:hypothetical protein